jgi:thiol-disulfide isomerase/thioredoxin
MRTKYLLIAIMALIMQQVNGQSQTIDAWHQPIQQGITNLNIGDKVPDFKIAKIYNNDKSSASVSDFNDRLLIFDFGNTGCGGCIAALPHMDKLQKEFGNKIKIFWVTYEPESVIKKFWEHSKLTQNNSIPTIVEDSTVTAYFRHELWPHEVWVYKGRVIAITDPDYVDEHNIKAVLDGNTINWPVKNDYYTFDPYKKAVFGEEKEKAFDTATSMLKYRRYTAIAGYREGAPSGTGFIRDSVKKCIRVFNVNVTIWQAYAMLWDKFVNFSSPDQPGKPHVVPRPPSNQLVFEVADKSKYVFIPEKDYWAGFQRKNGFCYESVFPDTGQTDKEIYRKNINDLNELLGLQVHWERRKEKCLVLVRTTKEDKMKTKGGKVVSEEDHPSIKDLMVQFSDTPLSSLAYLMNQEADNPAVFDETHYKGNVDMKLNLSSWTNIPAIRKAIQPYGLDLKEEERMVDRFVFKEVK